MSAPNTIIVAGNLTADPEYRKTANEIPFTRLRVAVSRRVFVGEKDTWEDRTDGYFSVTAWREMAGNAFRSLHKGDRVVIHGRLTTRQFEVKTDEGTESRTVTEIDADEIGASLRWHSWARAESRPLNEGDPLAPGERAEDRVTTGVQTDDDGDVTAAA